MSKTTEPNWMLTDDYAVGIDPLNWKLYRRTMDKKTGNPKGWKVIEYHPTLKRLLSSVMDALMLTDTGAADIPTHVKTVIEACESASSALDRFMSAIGAGLDTLPPKYASYETIKSTTGGLK